jgi:hypothetical protein
MHSQGLKAEASPTLFFGSSLPACQKAVLSLR